MSQKIALIFLISVIISCKKDDPKPKIDPAEVTTSFIELTNEGFRLNGIFSYDIPEDIDTVGFVWGEVDNLNNTIKLFPQTEFDYTININDLIPGKAYESRAFVTIAEERTYGNYIQFNASPKINSTSSLVVTDLDTVQISGNYFGNSVSNISISISGIEANLLFASIDSIAFQVPTGISSGNHNADLLIFEQSLKIENLTIKGPKVNSASPNEGYDGTVLRLEGDYFSENLKILFDGNEVTPTLLSRQYIELITPLTTSSGQIDLSLESSGNKKDVIHFTILDHSVSDISPSHGKIGDIITITGNNFIQLDRESMIEVEGMVAEIETITENEIVFRLPNHEFNSAVSEVSVINGLKSRVTSISVETSWTEVAEFTEAIKERCFVLETSTQVYLGFGDVGNINGTNYSDLWALDKSTQSWNQLADLPISNIRLSFIRDDKLYASQIGGLGKIQVYDMTNGSWSSGGSHQFTGLLLRESRNSVVFQNKVFFTSYDRILSFDFENDTWQAETGPRSDHGFDFDSPSIFEQGGILHLITNDEIIGFNPLTNSLFSIHDLPELTPKGRFLIGKNSRFFFGAGDKDLSTETSKVVFEYDPSINELIRRENLPAGLDFANAFIIDDKIWIGNGDSDSGYIRTYWEFNPD